VAYKYEYKTHAAIKNRDFSALAQTIPIFYNANVVIAISLYLLLWLQTARPQAFPFQLPGFQAIIPCSNTVYVSRGQAILRMSCRSVLLNIKE
jgi:hypothetical protein